MENQKKKIEIPRKFFYFFMTPIFFLKSPIELGQFFFTFY